MHHCCLHHGTKTGQIISSPFARLVLCVLDVDRIGTQAPVSWQQSVDPDPARPVLRCA
eukprot:COSAG02_NODE_13388_length_1400_cov_6.504336_2_plen_57_part_01